MSENKRLHVIVTGRVQGVFFRAYTKETAAQMGLSGWVRNRNDGTVEALIEGEKDAVDKMLKWFHQGSPHSVVESVEATEETPVGDSSTFEVRYH